MSNKIILSSFGDIEISHVVRFWLYLLLEIPSIICSIFVLSHFILIRTLRYALYNHVIIILLFYNLIIQLTDIPWIIHYYRLEIVKPATHSFCMIWIFIDESLSITTTILFSWATIERHILIFHDRWLSTRIKIIIIHYFPIIFLSLYCLCFSIVVIIFPPCENIFDYTKVVCGYPLCYYNNEFIGFWDTIVNHMLPTVVIILGSATLLGRILYQKKRVRQPIHWRKHRKMTIQLLSISVLYLILYIPETLLEFAYLCGLSKDIGVEFILYSNFFSYYVYLLFPFVCAGSLPHLKKKIKKCFPCWRRQRRAIAPKIFRISPTVNGQYNNEPTTVC